MTNDTHLHDLPPLRNRSRVFHDRSAAGVALAAMLEAYRGGSALVLAIPAGGVPVAAEVAASLTLPLAVVPVSKVLLPWTTEAGYGAVAFDGTQWIDDDAVARFGLTEDQVAQAVADAREKVARRMARWYAGSALPQMAGRTVIVVDDGIAAGSTLRTAVAAVRQQGAGTIVVAVPTAHGSALGNIARLVDEVYCPNVRSGLMFAVADAYEEWRDVSDEEVARILERAARP